MDTRWMIHQELTRLFHDAYQDIQLFYATTDPYTQQLLLQQMWSRLTHMQFLSDLLYQDCQSIQQTISSPHLTAGAAQTYPFTAPMTRSAQTDPSHATAPTSVPSQGQRPAAPAANPPQIQQQQPERTFTREELAQYTGRGGFPAYVAVNGIVYDVTNNAGWAAGTHFGLQAGKDYTQEFASCHAGQAELLRRLPVVGRLTP